MTPHASVSLILGTPLTSGEALAAVAGVLDRTVVGIGTANSRVELSDSCWVSVDVPKFGEDVQLAYDVHSTVGRQQAVIEALTVRDRMRAAGWPVELLAP